MLNTKKVIFYTLLVGVAFGTPLLSMEEDLDGQLRIAQKKLELSRLNKEKEENNLKAAQAKQQAQQLQTQPPQVQPKKQNDLEALANKPRPSAGASKGEVAAHNVTVETARGVVQARDFLKNLGKRGN